MGSTAPSLTSSLPTMCWLNICLMSSTAMAPSQSCLLARTSVGTPSTRWSVTIVSAHTRERQGQGMDRGMTTRRTEDGPALLYPLLVGRVDDKHDGVAVGIVLCPDAPNVALAYRRSTGQYSPECRSRCRKRTAEVPELQHARRQRDPPDCRRRDCVSWSSSGNDRVVSVLF